MRKGQVEFVVIIGLIAVMAVVIFLGYQAFTAPTAPAVPAAIAQEQKLVQDYVTNVIRAGLDDTVEMVETRGGYLLPTVGVAFMNNPVAYWQQCDSTMYPSLDFITENIEAGLVPYIRNNLDPEAALPGKRVEFSDRMGLDINILDSRIDVIVDLPTSIENYTINRPYTVSYPTRLKRIYDFAKDFSEEAADTRFLETLTAASVLTSTELHSIGFLLECGEILYVSKEDISKGIKNAIAVSLLPIKFWERDPPGPGTYALETVNGHKYEDLDIRFWLPDDFDISVDEPIMIVNDELLISSSLFVISECIKPYIQTYAFSYPAVVRVHDDLSGHYFNFASLVFVNGLEPGDCGAIEAISVVCDELPCSANITVTDTSGDPIRGALVNFGGCELGRTGFDGSVTGPTLCGEHELRVFNAGYDVLRENVSSSEINGTYAMNEMPVLDMQFYEISSGCAKAPIDNEQILLTFEGLKNYSVVNTDHSFDMAGCIGEAGEDACDYCGESGGQDVQNCTICNARTADCQKQALVKNKTIDYIPSGPYNVSALVMNPKVRADAANHTDVGFALLPIRIPGHAAVVPGKPNAQLRVYVPETDSVYAAASNMYTASYNSHLGDCLDLLCDEKCDENCSKAMAMVEVLDYMKSYTAPGGEFDTLLGCVAGEMVKEIA